MAFSVKPSVLLRDTFAFAHEKSEAEIREEMEKPGM